MLVPIINDINYEEIFMNYFQKEKKFKLEMLTETSFKCLQEFMMRYNYIKKSLAYTKNGFRFLKGDFMGIFKLWDILYFSKDSRIIDLCMNCICEIYINFIKDTNKIFSKTLDRIIQTGLSKIVAFDKEKITCFIKILNRFVSK